MPRSPRLTQLWFLYPLVIVTPLALLGWFDPILVNPGRYLELLFASLLLIVLTISLILLALAGQRSYLWHYLHEKRWSKIGFVLVQLAALLLMAPPAMALGIPSLLHRLGSQPAEQVVTVVGKHARYEAPLGCAGKLYIAEYDHLLNDSLCDLPYELWATAKRDDTLLLTGERSLLGFKPLLISLRNPNGVETTSGLPLFTDGSPVVEEK
ncbi:hypothetical protein [Pseudomonas sp. BMS12]|uniref:hypothetical protein n=1 Tax=Pseudomonas sp. BMS12 TaxID=1796033 RepID=UPI00083BA3AE|nr:hypothetical protein [Pseudomonas sp. BMS12]